MKMDKYQKHNVEGLEKIKLDAYNIVTFKIKKTVQGTICKCLCIHETYRMWWEGYILILRHDLWGAKGNRISGRCKINLYHDIYFIVFLCL